MKIEIYPANSGDAFLMSFGENLSEHLLIDTGFKETYDKHIKKRLSEISERDEHLNLLVITHIDQDHIGGAIELLKENGGIDDRQIIEIDEIWHNSYRHLELSSNQDKKFDIGHEEILKAILLQNKTMLCKQQQGKISAMQGSMLASYILEHQYNWNLMYSNKAVAVNGFSRNSITDELNIIVLSPRKESLDKLKNKWKAELTRKRKDFIFESGKLFDDAFEFYMMRQDSDSKIKQEKKISSNSFDIDKIKDVDEDNSVTNESSIAFIIEYKKQKLLFLGDANPSIIIKSLLELKETFDYDLIFDLVKLAHHGSLKNTTVDLLNNIEATRWVVSGNGGHGNPDPDTIKRIIKQKSENSKKIYFNYLHEWLQEFEDKDLKQTYNYEIIVLQDDGKNLEINLGGQ